MRYYSHGKLLLSGEYVVLDGAISLAIPTQYGQSLVVEPIDEPNLIWQSFDETGAIWFENTFPITKINLDFSNPLDEISNTLIHILKSAKQLNPSFLNSTQGYLVKTRLDFPRQWGLGTSSTLINNIANWVQIDAFQLLKLTFGGSGYDIACAQHNQPITYQIKDDVQLVNEVNFNPRFKEHLYFVYLNKKQNSREGIAKYNTHKTSSIEVIQDISDITSKLISCQSLSEFEILLKTHETIIANIIKQQPINEILFSDFPGSIKSLGAWGGDFILATSKDNPSEYFKTKGFNIVIPYKDMIFKP
jgi:mevalonate kinase